MTCTHAHTAECVIVHKMAQRWRWSAAAQHLFMLVLTFWRPKPSPCIYVYARADNTWSRDRVPDDCTAPRQPLNRRPPPLLHALASC